MPDNKLPLSGITVLAFEHAIAAPFCTRQLADQGARVIKVERREQGDFARAYDERVLGQSSHFIWTNRGKESLTLDIKHPDAAEVLRRLMDHCDVLIENLAPGALQRIGLGHETVCEAHPKLVYCSISGYGSNGPYSNRKAYDLLVQAESGFLSVTGTVGSMAKSGISIADIAAGTQAHGAILAALLNARTNGTGDYIEISMLEAMVEWMGFPLYYSYDKQDPPTRSGADHASIYPYGAFSCKDQSSIMLGIQNEREWERFCDHVLQIPSLATDPLYVSNSQRSVNRDELRKIIQDRLLTLPIEEVTRELDAAGIAWARVNTMQDVWNHPQLHSRHRFAEFGTPTGKVLGTLPPTAQINQSMQAVPELGEHTWSILSELGYSAEEVANLQTRRVV